MVESYASYVYTYICFNRRKYYICHHKFKVIFVDCSIFSCNVNLRERTGSLYGSIKAKGTTLPKQGGGCVE